MKQRLENKGVRIPSDRFCILELQGEVVIWPLGVCLLC